MQETSLYTSNTLYDVYRSGRASSCSCQRDGERQRWMQQGVWSGQGGQARIVGVPEPLDVLFERALPEPEWVIPGILPRGVTLLTGAQGMGKTGLALALALAVAGGTPGLGGLPALSGEVLFLGLEQSKRCLFGRARKLLQGREVPHSLEWTGSWMPLREGGLADIEEWLEAHPLARLVVIDTLDAVHPLSGRLAGCFLGHSALMLPFQAMTVANRVAVLILHHQLGERAAGVLGLAAGMMDCVMEIRAACEGHAGALLHIAGNSLEEKDIVFDPEQGKKLWRL